METIVLLLWGSVAMIAYIFVGYPLAIWGLSKFFSMSRNTSIDINYQPTVDVILIVRNVEDIIRKKIENLLALNYSSNKLNIIIVSDQSTDNTCNLIRSIESERITLIENNTKSSKSACLNQSIKSSKAEILFLTDARQEIEKDCIKYLVQHFSNNEIGAVSGELVFIDPETNDVSKSMDAYWKYEKFIRSNESKIASVPGVTGAVYALRRQYFKPIPNETLLDDVLIPMNLVLEGKKVLFDSRAIAYDIPSDDLEREKIRKIRTLAGNWQLLEFKPSLLLPIKNPIWLQFISHKILRLLSPFLLLMIFISSYMLKNNFFYSVLFFCQLAFYSVAIIATHVQVINRVPLVGIVRAFCSLMWFTFLGTYYFVSRKHLGIWK